MYRHRTSRFRTLRPDLGPSRWQRLQQRSGLVLLILAGLVTAALLYFAPRYYLEDQYAKAQQSYIDAHWDDFDAVERHWKSVPILQTVQRGDEQDVRQFLTGQPLVVALLDRFEGRNLWVRSGDRLVRSGNPVLTQRYLGWMAHAEAAQRFEWIPPKEQDLDFGKISTVVLLSDRWLVIKRWCPGSPEVEQALAIALGQRRGLRMGLIRESDLNRRDLLPLPWGAEPNLQADPQRLAATSLSATTKTNAFGEGWCLGGMAIEEEQVKYRNTAKRQRMMATSVASFVGLAIALGLWLRHRSRRKTELDADRLASMTHSLKTPLSILKFRCDSLRLGRLSPERADEELLKLGEEVDHLTTIIESGLRVIKGGGAAGPRGLANRGWFEDVADDLRPGFELEGRPLELRLCEVPGKAPLSSLRSSVATLLENALAHGKGRVTLETWQMKRRLCIQVRDEGEGLAPHQVKVLGKPFQRLRSQGQEGFMREGQGLGLSLLVQVAEQEGWGLTFASGPGEGFQATLEIPTAGTRFGA